MNKGRGSGRCLLRRAEGGDFFFWHIRFGAGIYMNRI